MTEATKRLQTLADFAVDLAREAGGISLKYFGTDVPVETKSDDSPVTVADKETELFLRAKLERAWPKFGIIGEEFGAKPATDDEGFTWVIDPIDGTKSFVAGVPLYTMLIALLHGSEPVFGLIHQPVSGEMLWGANDLGAWYNGRPARVSGTKTLAEARVMLTDLTHLRKTNAGFADRLVDSAKYSRTWGDGYGYLLVATGRADIMVDPKMSLWDVAPMQPIMVEAGGCFGTILGQPTVGDSCLVTNKLLWDQVLALHLQRQ
jgi:histidinol-phosphatase